jgi:O-antigen/teichoic acid export membrane protein
VWISFAALAGGVIIAAPGIVSTVFGETYEPSVAVARILTLGVLATIPGAQFEVLFTSTGDEPRLYRQRSLFASTQLILVGSGAYVFGLTGAVWGNALTYALNSLYGFLLDRQGR